MLADIRDYFMYLTLDSLKDPSLARTLIDRFSQLQGWLRREHINQALKRVHPDKIVFYQAFLFTLEQVLSLRHGVTKLPNEKISRADFMRSWKKTAEKLGLS